MGWLGKILGTTLGFAIGGPFGAILGTALGHGYDSEVLKLSEEENYHAASAFTEKERSHAVFFIATFSLIAKIAKADGVVSLDEIEVVEKFASQELGLTGRAYKFAESVFIEAKQSSSGFEDFAHQFKSIFRENPNIRHMMLDLLIRIAAADGDYHDEEERMILRAAEIFGISVSEYELIKKQYVKDLRKYYALLEVSENDCNEEIKKQYKKLVKSYHPDVIISKGLPEEFIKFANTKFSEIKEAYEVIRKERNIE